MANGTRSLYPRLNDELVLEIGLISLNPGFKTIVPLALKLDYSRLICIVPFVFRNNCFFD